MKKRWPIGLGVLIGALALGGVWFAWRPVPLAGVLETSGRIEGDQAAVGAKIEGKLVRVVVREGDRLEAGALIAELASDQVQAQLERAEHGLRPLGHAPNTVQRPARPCSRYEGVRQLSTPLRNRG